MREDYSLYPRKTRSGKRIWYYRLPLLDGSRSAGKSTGCTSKAAAHYAVQRILAEQPHDPVPTLNEYAGPWWIFGRCPYLQRQTELGRAPTKIYAQTRRQQLKTWILPRLGSRPLDAITATDLHQLLIAIRDSGRSPTTANHIGKTLMIMLKQAVRDGLISAIPVVDYLTETPKARGMFSLEEVQVLLSPDHWREVWSDDILQYTLNATAACTGLRMGELQALRTDCVKSDHIEVRRSWDRLEGLKERTKTGVAGVAPLPKRVLDLIKVVSPDSGFVFSTTAGRTPVYHQTITTHFRAACTSAEIHDCRERRLSMHSWRHWFNTWCRSQGVPDPLIRKVTRHRTAEMTEHYTHFSASDYAPIVEAQGQLFEVQAG